MTGATRSDQVNVPAPATVGTGGADALRAWNGAGAVQLISQQHKAILLERAGATMRSQVADADALVAPTELAPEFTGATAEILGHRHPFQPPEDGVRPAPLVRS